ncbi:MAG: hypothetical protein HY072_01130 [Deltaproteobacteria bacterium]|nr:hypothetical protein [Deltaproteobacteria bacterium]
MNSRLIVCLIILFQFFCLTSCERNKEIQYNVSKSSLSLSNDNIIKENSPKNNNTIQEIGIKFYVIKVTNSSNIRFSFLNCNQEISYFIQEIPFPLSSVMNTWNSIQCGRGEFVYALKNKSEGTHTLKIWAKNKITDTVVSSAINFDFDKTPPEIVFHEIPEYVQAGHLFTLEWEVTEKHSSSKEKIKIYYSLDEGQSWSLLDSVTPREGGMYQQKFKIQWVIPKIENGIGMFKIEWKDAVKNEVMKERQRFVIINKVAIEKENASRNLANTAISCPNNYILVNKNPEVGTENSFCVAKFEMKAQKLNSTYIEKNGCGNHTAKCDGQNRLRQEDFQPVSSPEGTPWVQITRNEAVIQCKKLGKDFDLISNSQWMTVARDIELNKENWRKNEIEKTEINIGHCDNAPGTLKNTPALSVLNPGDPWDGVKHGDSKEYEIWALKRTHLLSFGEEIWDFGGNVWEWVKDYISLAFVPTDQPDCFKNSNCWVGYNSSEWFLTSINAETYSKQFAPFYKKLTHMQVGGKFFPQNPSLSGSEFAMVRGGKWDGGQYGGIYAAWLYNFTSSSTSHEVGFRCVFTPENSN